MGLFGRKKEEDIIKIPNEIDSKEYHKEENLEETLQREKVKKELELLRKELDETATILDSTSSRLDALRNEYYSKSSEIDSLNDELQKKRSDLRSIKTEYARVKSEFDRLNSELASIRAEYNPRILESTKQEIELTRNVLTELNFQKEDAKFSLGYLHSQIDSAKLEFGELTSKIDKARSELDVVTSKNEATKKETAMVKKELEFMQRELASPYELDRTRKISQAAASLVASVNEKSAGLKKEIEFLKESLARAMQENRKLEEMLGVPQDIRKIMDAKSELQLLQSQQQIKKKELDQSKRELEFMQRELASLYSKSNAVSTIEKPQEQPARQITERPKREVKMEEKVEEKPRIHYRHKLSVLLLPLGPVATVIMESLQASLSQQFKELRFELASNPLSLPLQFIDTSRNQFRSPQVINWVEKNCAEAGYDRILAICDADAYSGDLNFVMGEAQLGGLVAVLYLKMFRTEVTSSDMGKELFFQRIQKESIHELGHVFGLEHCTNNTCVMYFSNSLADTDFKSSQMCQSCMKKMLEQIY